jgi:hypothetical protein
MKLEEWLLHYIKFKDSLKRQIVSIEETPKKITVKEKTSIKTYYVDEDINKLLDKKENEQYYYVVLNTHKNVKIVIEQWNIIKEQRKLTIIFSNPHTNESWLLHPKTHHDITEPESLQEGLNSLYQSISAAD